MQSNTEVVTWDDPGVQDALARKDWDALEVAGLVRVWKNGVVADAATNKIIDATGSSTKIASSEDGRSLAQHRWELYQEAVRQGVIEGTGAKDDVDAVRILTAHQAEVAVSEDKRASGLAYDRVMGRLMQDRDTSEERAPGQNLAGFITQQGAEAILALAEAVRRRVDNGTRDD